MEGDGEWIWFVWLRSLQSVEIIMHGDSGRRLSFAEYCVRGDTMSGTWTQELTTDLS